MSTAECLLSVQALSIRTQAEQVLLSDASLSLMRGQRLTIVGESGAGKSLLAQAIMGTLPKELIASGSIHIAQHATHGKRHLTEPLWGHTVAMLPQEPWNALSPLMRMGSQVAESARYSKPCSWAQARQLAHEKMAQLGVAHASQQYLHQISGGMAQRVGVAASTLGGADLLLADEPTKGLDEHSRGQVAQLLLALQGADQALLTITHDLALAVQLGGLLMVMQKGQVLECGEVASVLQSPQHPYTQALIAAQPKHWAALVAPLPQSPECVIQARGLAKSFGDRELFRAYDLSLSAGEIVAISGPSGCGKTTLGNVLLGLLDADAGSINRRYALGKAYQKLYQDPPAAFAPQRTLGGALHDVARLHRLDTQRIEPLMHELRLHPDLLDRLPAQVSGGELQRMALLRLLLVSPAFIFADEPTSRLDVITQHETMKLLTRSAQQQGCAVLLVSHDADLARASSHRHHAMLG